MKMIKKINVDCYFFILCLLSVLFLASIVRYGLRTYQIPTWDEQHYMRMSTEFYRLLHHPSLNTPHDMLQVVPFRQPGYPLLIVPFYFLFGLSNAYFWAQVANGLLYIASIFGIYFLSKLYLSKLASFLAAFIFTFYGWTLLHVHLAYSETAVSAFSILTILFLMKSNYFQNRKYSVLFGVFFGCALLMKWMSLVYIFGPTVYIFYHFFKKRLFTQQKAVVSIIISFLLTFIVSFYPYYANFPWYFSNLYNHRQGGLIWQIVPEQERNPFSVYSLTFYLNSFAQLGIFYFLLLIAGFFLAFRKTSTMKPILLTFLIGYVFSVYAVLKAERHIVPIYPYIAILSASAFDYLRKSWQKTGLIVFTLILSVVSFLGTDWGKGPMKQSLYTLPITLPFGQMKKIYLTAISRPPYIYKISGREILDFIVKDSKANKQENPQVLSLFYYRPLDEPLMAYNLYNQEKPLEIINYLGTIIQNPEKDSKIFLQNVFNNSDYILMKSGQRTDDYFPKNNYQTLKALIALFDNHVSLRDYYEIKAKFWIYQDSSMVTVLKKKKNVPDEELQKMRDEFVKNIEKM